jgi:hypothetical protein
MSTTLFPPLYRRMSSEVIDVDLLGDNDIAQPPARRRRINADTWTALASSSDTSSNRGGVAGSSREVIVIDSDDEDAVLQPSKHLHPCFVPLRIGSISLLRLYAWRVNF